MYRSLSDRGSFTEYVYVFTAPLVTADRVVLNPIPFLFLSGYRILCLHYHLGHRPPLLTVGYPASAAPCTLHLSPSQRGLRWRMRRRRSSQMPKCTWSRFRSLADQSPALRIRPHNLAGWDHLAPSGRNMWLTPLSFLFHSVRSDA